MPHPTRDRAPSFAAGGMAKRSAAMIFDAYAIPGKANGSVKTPAAVLFWYTDVWTGGVAQW